MIADDHKKLKGFCIVRILMIEDDLDLCEAVRCHLIKDNYEADICTTGTDALFYASQQAYDAIILDRMLPGIDGMTILQSIRRNGIQTPIILATAMNDISDRIDGLDAGADDYIVKPFDVLELMARVRALTRRPAALLPIRGVTCGDLELCIEKHSISCGGQMLSLSKRESDLFEYFIKNAGQTLPRSLILTHVWGPDTEVEDGNLDNYIHFLRKRLKTLDSRTKIVTIHGVGYRMEESDDS
nr:response regulator transcription factor [Dorea sp. D27]